jgi:hypothetical protein
MECDSTNHIFHMVFHQDIASSIEDLREKHSGTLEDYSRRLQDYSKINWSTFQPQDDSSILEDFQLVELGDAQGLLTKAVKTTRRHPARLQSTHGLVVWTSQGPRPRQVPGPTTAWAPRTTLLRLHSARRVWSTRLPKGEYSVRKLGMSGSM